MGLQVKSTLAGPVNAPLFTAMIGGNGSIVPVNITVLRTGLPRKFVVDNAVRFFYFLDATGNLLQWDSTTPGVAPVQIVSAATIGTTIQNMDIAMDNSALYATTLGNTVIKILTASPFTVSLVAGSGSNTRVDGIGVAASFQSPFGIAVDIVDGLTAYTWELSGFVRSVVLSSGLVTSLAAVGANNNPIVVSKARTVFSPINNAITSYNIPAATVKTTTIGSGLWVGAFCVDDDEPEATNMYYFRNTDGTKLSRWNIPNAAQRNDIATTAVTMGATQVLIQAGRGFFRHPAYYCVDTGGNLLRMQE